MSRLTIDDFAWASYELLQFISLKGYGMKNPTKATLVLLAVLLGIAACNTVEGVGQDIKGAGSAIERSAK
jgi:predicted small secreted protein